MNPPIYQLLHGSRPLLISIPHNGQLIPPEIAARMTEEGRAVPDTDFHLDKLYHFASELGCHLLISNYSRYVIDLNRPSDDSSLYPGADVTGLCPVTRFDHQPIYLPSMEPNSAEREARIDHYWKPYHRKLQETLAALKQRHDKVVLFEAHSIASQVPRFFEGILPDFNFGTADGQSCDQRVTSVLKGFDTGDYSKVINGRFKGGYITRAYGEPEQGISSVQLELSQRTYLEEESLQYETDKAAQVAPVLQRLLAGLLEVC